MKKDIGRMTALLCAVGLIFSFTACMGQGSDPTQTTKAPSAETTTEEPVTADEPVTPDVTAAELAKGVYTLESEADGYDLTLDAGDGMPVYASEEEKNGRPCLNVRSAETDAGLQLYVMLLPAAEADAEKARALENGGKQISIGHYAGVTLAGAPEAAVTLAALPDGSAVYTLRIVPSDGDDLQAVLSDAGIAAFLASLVFNLNV